MLIVGTQGIATKIGIYRCTVQKLRKNNFTWTTPTATTTCRVQLLPSLRPRNTDRYRRQQQFVNKCFSYEMRRLSYHITGATLQNVHTVVEEEVVNPNNLRSISNRNQERKTLLDAINQIVKKQKHFWSIDELNNQTKKLIDYCNNVNQNNNQNERPSDDLFYQVLEAWMEQSMNNAKNTSQQQQQQQGGSALIDSAERARMLLDAMIPKRNLFQSQTELQGKRTFLKSLITTSHYEVVLQAYAVSNAGLPAAIRAESLLLQMVQRYRSYIKQIHKQNWGNSQKNKNSNKVDGPPIPTLKTFNIVFNCWAKSNSYEAPDRINALFLLLEELGNTYAPYNNVYQRKVLPPSNSLPNERSFLCLIEAWSNGRPNEAPEIVTRILQNMMIASDYNNAKPESTYNTNTNDRNIMKYQNVQLDEAVFNAVIYAWVRSNRGRIAATKAEEILQMMIQWSQIGSNNTNVVPVQPTTRTYSMIIMAWAECEASENVGDAAKRAETILRKMVQLYSEGQGNVKPNSLLFTSCIAAWSRAASNCADAPLHAEGLWELLRKLYVETGCKDIELEPTTQIGNAIISSWSRCTSRPDSVERALNALEILKQEKKDDLISYNTVLDAMSKKGYAQDALNLLRWLESNAVNNSFLTPDLVTYNSVLAALGRSSTTTNTSIVEDNDTRFCSAEEAEKLLRRMEQMQSIKPNKMSYTSVMNAWSRSENPQKTQRVSALLKDMIQQYEKGNDSLKPDVYVYTTLIKTCAHHRGGTKLENMQVLQMALNAMATLENTDFGPPNDVSYSAIMAAIYRLSDDKSNDQDRHYEAAFRQCSARGLLSNDVMEAFQRGASMRLFRRLTKNTGKLQPQWSRNIPNHKRPAIQS